MYDLYVYLLHSKDEALEKFKVFKSEVELQCETFIKCLRTDRGGEYYDPNYFETTGIIHQVTAPYTPQQNGVAERKNRTLTEMVNAMLSGSGLSKGFWGEAMLTACHVLNRVPMKKGQITPYELWKKRKPNLNYLRVWGCRAIVKVPEPKRKKIGERGVECIFLGYAQESKACRFMVIESNESISVNTVIESRDAIFDETRFDKIVKPLHETPRDVNPEIEKDLVAIEPKETPEIRKEKKILTRFNVKGGKDVYTPFDSSIKLVANDGNPIDQLEYSRVIGCLMYAMTCTRPDIAYAVRKLSRYTSNPSVLHWQAIYKVLRYLKTTLNYGICYSGEPSVSEGFTDASWISDQKDHSSTSG